MEKIYNTAFDLIEIRLKKKEEILPFTVILDNETGKPEIQMHELKSNNTADDVENIRSFLQKRAKEGNIEAVCLCYSVKAIDPRTEEKVDAVKIELAGKDKDCIDIYLPYNFNEEEIIKKPFQVASERKFF
jgi:hypothetical protein